MKKNKQYLVTVLLISAISYAQSGGNYAITKSTIDNGGGISSGGSFVITGALGQVDASAEITGGSYVLTGGFWAQKTIPKPDAMFSDGFEN